MKIKVEKKKIGVVVVHYGNKNDTLDCLNALNKTRTSGLEIIVYLVDNGSKNKILLKDLKYKLKIILLNIKINRGIAVGGNLGIKTALKDKCDYIMSLNNDIIVKKDIFDVLLPYLKNNIKIVVPMLVYYDKPDIIWCVNGYLNKRFLYSKYPYMNRKINSLLLPEVIYSDFAGACMIVDSEVYSKIGLYDERYFFGVEEIEWCFRAKSHGYKLIYTTKTKVLHKVAANTGIRGSNNMTPMLAYYSSRNFFIFLKDHITFFNVFTALIGQTFIRLPFYIVFRMNSFVSALSYIKGYIHGWDYLFTGKLRSL